nr:unnamed protein product [Spirometra erinaceieuropaei]
MRIRLQPRRTPQFQSTALTVLGRVSRQYQDWCDENDPAIKKLLAEKNRLHKAYVDRPTDDNKTAFYSSRRVVQQQLREMQDAWVARKTKEIQVYADRNEWQNVFAAIKTVYGLTARGNHQGRITGLQRESARSDAIPAEICGHGGPQLMDHLKALFQERWHQGDVLQDFKDATIVQLHKRQGNRQTYNNHGSIGPLKIAGKVFAHILLSRLNKHLEHGLLPESHCGYRPHRGTTDIIFSVRELQERCREMLVRLYSTFVGLNLMFSAMLMDAYRDECSGIRVAYMMDGHILNCRRMHFQSRISTTTLHELLFAACETAVMR